MSAFLTRWLAVVITAAVAVTANALAVSGVVTDAGSGNRLPSMIVRAYSAAGDDIGILSTTDSEGRYILGLPPGDYRILAYDQNGLYATSFAGDADSFETSPPLTATSDDITNYNFALRLGGTITGRVMSGSSSIGEAVVAAYNLSGTRRGFTTAGAGGDYSIVLPPGKYKLVAFDDGKLYAPTFFLNAVSFDAATQVVVVAETTVQGIDFALPRAGRLSGFVIDGDTGAPVEGMLITAYDRSGSLIASQQMTNDQFDIAVPPGTYQLVVADPAHHFAPQFYGGAASFAGSTPITVGSSEFRSGLRFDVVPASHILGSVIGGASAPLKGITVSAYNLDGSQRTSVQTGADGKYLLDLPSGDFKIVLFDEGLVYAPQFYSGASDFRSANEVLLASQQDLHLDFQMAVGGNFSGIVTDAATNARLPGIIVAAYESSGDLVATGKTNEAGEYKLVVPAGSYRLTASDPSLRYAAGYSGGASAFELAEETRVEGGSNATVSLRLTSGVIVPGTVREIAQHAVTGVEIAVLDPAGNRVATALSVDGRFVVNVLPGTYELLAIDPQHRYLASFYEGAATLGEATPVTIRRDTPPPPVDFILSPVSRRRSASH